MRKRDSAIISKLNDDDVDEKRETNVEIENDVRLIFAKNFITHISIDSTNTHMYTQIHTHTLSL